MSKIKGLLVALTLLLGVEQGKTQVINRELQDLNYARLDNDSPNIVHLLGYGRVMNVGNHQFVLSGFPLFRFLSFEKGFYPYIGVRFMEQSPVWQQDHWIIAQKISLDLYYEEQTRPPYMRYNLIPQFEVVGGHYRQKWLAGAKLGVQLYGYSHYVSPPERAGETSSYPLVNYIYAPVGGVTLWDQLGILLSVGGQRFILTGGGQSYNDLYFHFSLNYYF